jgi:hypothetical protein
MRRLIALAFLFAAGCATGPNPDAVAAEKYVRNGYTNVEMVQLESEEPEYAAFPKIPNSHRPKPADRPAACGVRVRFTWRDEGRTTHDDWLVWVTSDHEAIEWTSNPVGDNWRQYLRSHAAK